MRSYVTEIARAALSGEIVHNTTRYSVTTSHHQNLCRPWLVPEHEAHERVERAERRERELLEAAEASRAA